MASPRGQDGFSLIELAVALGVFAIAVLALLNANTQGLRAHAASEARTLALIVAENELVTYWLDPRADRLGVSEGETALGGRDWVWRRRVAGLSDPALRRVRVEVRAAGGTQVLAALETIRAAP